MSDQDKPSRKDFGTLGDPVFYATTEPLRVYRQFLPFVGVLSPLAIAPSGFSYPMNGSWVDALCYDRNFPGADAEHEPPVAGCGCGIYGWYQPDKDWNTHPLLVFGVVEVAGRLILGTTGLRAERARILAVQDPKELSYPALSPPVRPGGAIRLYDTREELVNDFPPSDWSALLDEPGAA